MIRRKWGRLLKLWNHSDERDCAVAVSFQLATLHFVTFSCWPFFFFSSCNFASRLWKPSQNSVQKQVLAKKEKIFLSIDLKRQKKRKEANEMTSLNNSNSIVNLNDGVSLSRWIYRFFSLCTVDIPLLGILFQVDVWYLSWHPSNSTHLQRLCYPNLRTLIAPNAYYVVPINDDKKDNEFTLNCQALREFTNLTSQLQTSISTFSYNFQQKKIY